MLETETRTEPHPSVTRYLLSQGQPDARRLPSMEGHIIHGDALKVLAGFPDNSVDLIHTSPPYNIDRPYQSDAPDRGSITDYTTFLTTAIVEIKRVLRPGGSIFWQTGYTQAEDATPAIIPIDYLSYDIFAGGPNPLTLWDRIIWRYWGGHAFKKKFTNKHETILWFVKPGSEPTFCVDAVRERAKEYDKRNNFWGRNPGNVWEVDRVAFGSTEQTSHVAVFPEELSERIIRACSTPDSLVLDPFSGSGTVAKVARGLGRRWLGVELSPVYAAESAVRVGYQQPSEHESLASELVKSLVFRREPASRSLAEAAQRLQTWIASAGIDRHRTTYETDIETVFHDGNGRNYRKRDVWAKYDSLLQGNSHASDTVAICDSLLLSCYKLRPHLSGVSRYRSALEALGHIASNLLSGDPEAYVEAICRQEPSSFRLSDGAIELLTDRRSIPVDTGKTDQAELSPNGSDSTDDDGDDSFQRQLL